MKETRNIQLFKLYDAIIAQNKINRDLHKEEGHDLFSFMRNFAMVTINLGRDTAKTKYISYRVQPNDIVVIRDRYLLREYSHANRVIIANSNFESNIKGIHLNGESTLWFDDYSLMNITNEVKHKLWYNLYRDINQTIVLMG